MHLRHLILVLPVAIGSAIPLPSRASPPAQSPAAPILKAAHPAVDEGFRLLYSLKFEEARAKFAGEVQADPDSVLGHAAFAAGYLFEEFYRQGVLTSDFFLDDKKFLVGIEGRPDPQRRKAFLDANDKARRLAEARLARDKYDAGALLTLSLTTGMQADYLAVLEKKQIASLKYIKEAEEYAKRLVALQPDADDAYLALGASNYIIGSLPGYKRFFLWFGGIRGQKELGMEQLARTAKGGHYVRPFAKILLALACLREQQAARARVLLQELAAEFPENPLFARELALLDEREKKSGARSGSR